MKILRSVCNHPWKGPPPYDGTQQLTSGNTFLCKIKGTS